MSVSKGPVRAARAAFFVVAAVVVAAAGFASVRVVGGDPEVAAAAAVTLSPGQSWQAAYVAAAPGDTIVVEGAHPVVRLDRDPGKDGKPRVVFQGGPGVSVAGFSSGSYGGSTGLRPGARHFELREMSVGGELKLVAAEDVLLERVDAQRVTFTCGTGISLVGSDVGPNNNSVSHVNSAPGCAPRDIEIRDSVFHDFTVSDPARHSECLMIWPTGGQNIRIANTVFRNCTDFNVLVKAPSSSGIVIERSFFDAPMPGDRDTLACNPGCPRGGNSIRYSGATNPYPGSAVTNNIVNGGIGVDCGCVPVSGNRPGTVPLIPPQPAAAPLTAPALTLVSFTETTVTASWQPVEGADGYRFYVDGTLVGESAGTSFAFPVSWGRRTLTVEAFNAGGAARGELVVESVWRVP